MANLSTSTRISSLTLYIINKSVNPIEEREDLTHCDNQDALYTMLMSRDQSACNQVSGRVTGH
jgi:hypothetical protein